MIGAIDVVGSKIMSRLMMTSESGGIRLVSSSIGESVGGREGCTSSVGDDAGCICGGGSGMIGGITVCMSRLLARRVPIVSMWMSLSLCGKAA